MNSLLLTLVSVSTLWTGGVRSQELSVLDRLDVETVEEDILATAPGVDGDGAGEDVTEASIYDLIINDRTSNNVTKVSESKDEDSSTEAEDVKKLLAAQVHAIEVFNMIKDLEVEMKVSIIYLRVFVQLDFFAFEPFYVSRKSWTTARQLRSQR